MRYGPPSSTVASYYLIASLTSVLPNEGLEYRGLKIPYLLNTAGHYVLKKGTELGREEGRGSWEGEVGGEGRERCREHADSRMDHYTFYRCKFPGISYIFE